MTAVESYGLTSAENLQMHLTDIEAQCEAALERYKALLAQRGIVLEALNEVLSHDSSLVDLELIPV
jgi:enamine deaminase RidA (YjgF/YER057c/UK114 family)